MSQDLRNDGPAPITPGVPPSGGERQEVASGFFRSIHPVFYALLSLFLVFFFYQIVGGGIALLIAGGSVNQENVALVRWTTLIGQLLFILVPTVVLARLRERRVLEFFRIHVPDYRHVIAAVVAVFALQQVLVGYMALQDLIPLPTELQKFLDLVKKLYEETYKLLLVAHTPFEFVEVLVVVAFVPAISEELLFRGLVQRNFEAVTGGLPGAVLAGLIFGAYHLIPTSFVPLAVLGIFLGFVVYRTGNITVAMAAHFFNNFVACAAIYLKLDEDFVAIAPSGTTTTVSMIINSGVFAVVFLGATLYLVTVTRTVRTEQSPSTIGHGT